jgi:hypothetical protein
VIQVHPLLEVRQRLPGILARFRHQGAAAPPVAFGSHRKPEAVLPDHDREVSAYMDGEVNAAELYRRTVARYRQP